MGTNALDESGFLGILKLALKHQVSDVHLRSGVIPHFRIRGELVPIRANALNLEDLNFLCRFLLQSHRGDVKLEDLYEIDGSFQYPNYCRVRYNIYRQTSQLSVVLRIIPAVVPSIDQLQLPTVLKSISLRERGLILVTGATGSGKSSTLAAMINHINENRSQHILTVEDPIEFVHANKKSVISQREIGTDTSDFGTALRAALRQDPDVILVGEMRDPETISVALKASETGHTVFSTVHTTDAVKTIGRLISVFPPEEQRNIRFRLAENLVATVSQRLLNRRNGQGRVVAQEILVNNQAIQECIVDPALTSTLYGLIEKGREVLGCQTFEQHLTELYHRGWVSLEDAKAAATNAADFERNLMFGAGQIRPGEVSKQVTQLPPSGVELEAPRRRKSPAA